MIKKITFLLLGVTLIAVSFIYRGSLYKYVSIFIEQYSPSKAQNEKKEETIFYDDLLRKNQSFANAESLMSSGKYTEASIQYKEALSKTEDSKEKGQLEFLLAFSYARAGNWKQAIPLLKTVAEETEYTNRIRAHAVQQLVSLIQVNPPAAQTEVFSGPPYNEFLKDNDYKTARYKLSEHAATLYPLGVSELRIASYVGKEALNSRNPDLEDITSLVQEKIKNADVYLEEIRNDPQSRSYTTEILYRKAGVLGLMKRLGSNDFPDPEDLFNQAIVMATALNSQSLKASAQYYYASYLSHMYGVERLADIQNLLKGFTQGTYNNTSIINMFRYEKENFLDEYENLLLLAQFDPDFGTFLRTLGWQI